MTGCVNWNVLKGYEESSGTFLWFVLYFHAITIATLIMQRVTCHRTEKGPDEVTSCDLDMT